LTFNYICVDVVGKAFITVSILVFDKYVHSFKGPKRLLFAKPDKKSQATTLLKL